MAKEYVWKEKPIPYNFNIQDFSNLKEIPYSILKLLYSRGFTSQESIKSLLKPTVSQIHSPFLMKGMNKAVQRIIQAIDLQENILVYGDYDVDGTTSVALMYSFLSRLTSNVLFYIPDRYAEGYGVSMQGIEYAYQNKISVIITLDCGIKAFKTIEKANSYGIDVIVCDHHEPDPDIPEAYSVLNPKQIDCEYPCKHLSGCGVGFKLIQAIAQNLKLNEKEYVYAYMDLVAVSIASDIVPMLDENRVLMYFGLKKLQLAPQTGLYAMLYTSGIHENKNLNVTDIVFKIAPRINAAGRIYDAKKAVELLIENNIEKAIELCAEIDTYNYTRKSIDKDITDQALAEILEDNSQSDATVLFNPDWHKGVIGIVASRLIETHYKPTVVLCGNSSIITGSARSVEDFDVYKALEKCNKYLLHFGGHKYAAGMAMYRKDFEEFKTAFNSVVKEIKNDKVFNPTITIDMSLEASDINLEFYDILQKFGPFGPEFMTPVFILKNMYIHDSTRAVGADKSHLKLVVVSDKNSKVFVEGIGFGLANKLSNIRKETANNNGIDVCFTIKDNLYRGKRTVQLDIIDIRKSSIEN